MLAAGLLVVHDAERGRQDDVSELLREGRERGTTSPGKDTNSGVELLAFETGDRRKTRRNEISEQIRGK